MSDKLSRLTMFLSICLLACTSLVDDPVPMARMTLKTPQFNADSSKIMLKAEITYEGGNATDILERGFYWNRTGQPDSSDFHIEAGSGTGEFSGEIMNPEAGKIYFIKAYMVVNEEGLRYSNERFLNYPE